jgi:ribosome-binding ATPase
MKICFAGFTLPEGKVKYQDPKVIELTGKCLPKKVTPFYVEFIKDDFVQGDGILINKDNLLDLLILDMEKLENRRDRDIDESERQLLNRCLEYLEDEIPLCDADFSEEELAVLKILAPLSLKPTLVLEEAPEVNEIIEKMLAKCQVIFFYTADKKEVHAWPVKKDSDIVTCAGKIHSDLARGFIKADIVKYEDFLKVFNMQEARTQKLVKLVDRDYLINEGDIIEIRFNV